MASLQRKNIKNAFIINCLFRLLAFLHWSRKKQHHFGSHNDNVLQNGENYNIGGKKFVRTRIKASSCRNVKSGVLLNDFFKSRWNGCQLSGHMLSTNIMSYYEVIILAFFGARRNQQNAAWGLSHNLTDNWSIAVLRFQNGLLEAFLHKYNQPDQKCILKISLKPAFSLTCFFFFLINNTKTCVKR